MFNGKKQRENDNIREPSLTILVLCYVDGMSHSSGESDVVCRITDSHQWHALHGNLGLRQPRLLSPAPPSSGGMFICGTSAWVPSCSPW